MPFEHDPNLLTVGAALTRVPLTEIVKTRATRDGGIVVITLTGKKYVIDARAFRHALNAQGGKPKRPS